MRAIDSSHRTKTTKLCMILLAAFLWMQVMLVLIVAVLRLQNDQPLSFVLPHALLVINATTFSQLLAALGIVAALGSQFLRSRLTEESQGVPFNQWILGLVLCEFVGLTGFILSATAEFNFEVSVIFSAVAIVCLGTYVSLLHAVRR